MPPLWGPSVTELEHLRSTVRALGATTVPGLSAALSWRERKTEKLLAHELAQPNSPLTYDPARRMVRWVPRLLANPASVAPGAPARPAPSTVPPTSPFPPTPAPVFTPTGLKTLCPACHVPLQTTGASGMVVCPQCGRLSSARTGATVTAANPAAPGPTAAPAPEPPSTAASDRRAQELFAAWVTNQPIPCPKCRTPLRHRGVSEYSCPACGQQVRFPAPRTDGPAAVAVAPPPAA